MIDDGCFFVPAEKTLVPFGRYKGKPLGTVPSGYLRWLAIPLSASKQAHATIWARLARRVLRSRSAFKANVDHDPEKLEQSTHTELSSFSNELLQSVDTLQSCPQPAALASLLQRCGSPQNLGFGWKAHEHIVLRGLEHHPLLRDLILQMYGDCGAFDEVQKHLTSFGLKNAIAWNRIIKAYTRHGYVKEVLQLFEFMLVKEIEPSTVTLLSILDACGKYILVYEGKLTHHSAIDVDLLKDIIIGNSLITMYGKCGSLDDASSVFEKMQKVDIVTWNALIAAFVQNGLSELSLCFCLQMKQEGFVPDEITYASILDACSKLASLPEGHRLHVHVLSLCLESSVVIGTALVCMYGKCRMPDNAYQSFCSIPQKNTVCWTAMIGVYAQNGLSKNALELFSIMEKEGVRPNEVTFVSVLDACATSANLSLGESFFDRIKSSSFATNIKVGTALMNMYGRCGRVECARAIFNRLLDRDVASWNAMIGVYAQHGEAKEALKLFNKMKQEGVRPDVITYVCVLSMCSRAGLVNDACEIITWMEHDQATASVEHHQNCMIDLLAKAGKLDEAEHLIRDSSLSYVSIMTLLGACNNQSDIKRGERMAQLLFRLGRGVNDPYVMMCGIRATHTVCRLANKSCQTCTKKLKGTSLIRIGGRDHYFIPYNMSHPLMEDIYSEVTRLTMEMWRVGYFSEIPRKDLEGFDQQKHTGIVAAAFGVISTPPKTSLYITKSSNLCPTSHLVIKFMSKVTSRKISVKDCSGIHRFKNGACSCTKLEVELLDLKERKSCSALE